MLQPGCVHGDRLQGGPQGGAGPEAAPRASMAPSQLSLPSEEFTLFVSVGRARLSGTEGDKGAAGGGGGRKRPLTDEGSGMEEVGGRGGEGSREPRPTGLWGRGLRGWGWGVSGDRATPGPSIPSPQLLRLALTQAPWCAQGSPRLLEMGGSSCLPQKRDFSAPTAHPRFTHGSFLHVSILQPVLKVASGEKNVKHKVS